VFTTFRALANVIFLFLATQPRTFEESGRDGMAISNCHVGFQGRNVTMYIFITQQEIAPPLIEHGRYGSHLGFGFCCLSDERLSTGPIFWCLIGVINLHHVPLLPKPYLPYTHRQHPTRGHMPCLALPLKVGC
jgi:hypothetical protein